MVARSGLFVDPVPGVPPVGTSMADARRALATLTGTAFRAAAGGTISTSGSTMQVTVAQSVWVLPDPLDAASAFLSPSDAVTVTLTSAPGTGSRIDLLVVKQNNFAGGDADSRANVSLITGVAGTPGVAPAAPAGAQVIAQITVPAGIANSAAATVTSQAARLAAARPPMLVDTYANLLTFVGAPGDIVTVNADATPALRGLYQWTGSAWIQMGGFGGGPRKQVPSAVSGGVLQANGDVVGAGTSQIRLDGVIDWSKWNRYLIEVTGNGASAASGIYFRGSFGGTVDGGNVYDYTRVLSTGSTSTTSALTAQNAGQIVNGASAATIVGEVLLQKYDGSARVTCLARGGTGGASAMQHQDTTIEYYTANAWSSMDGVAVFIGSGTVNLRVAVFAL